MHGISANAETACLPAFPDGPQKLRSLKTTELSVVSYFLTKRVHRHRGAAFARLTAGPTDDRVCGTQQQWLAFPSTMPKQFLNPPGLAAVVGPFSQGVRVGNTIWVSAQAGQDADGNVIGLNDPEAQCRALFERIRAVLAAGGAAPTDIVMVRGFLRHRDCLQATWKVRKEFFGVH